MSVTAALLRRTFAFKGETFPDPNPLATVDDVRQLLTHHRPELANAQIEGPVIEGDEQRYRFAVQIGTKG
jgi:PRTRC genetic system protein C